MTETFPAIPGVHVASTGVISSSIKTQVDRVLAEIPAGKSGALVAVATDAGINLAVAHRVGEGWQVAAWIGKSGWDDPINGGVFIRRVW